VRGDSGKDLGGAQLPERGLRQGQGCRGRKSSIGHQCLRDRLVEGEPGTSSDGADERQAQACQDVAQGAILPGGTMQERDDGVRTVLGEGPQQMGIDVPLRHLPVGRSLPKGLSDPPAGPQGYVPLGGQSPGEYGDLQGHLASGPGTELPLGSAGRDPVPKVRTSSSSDSTTAESRRTPSRMRSGVG